MTDPLSLEEAVPLGYAVMARVAADAGVRLLGIKGPILSAQGLRHERQSADIDVLVDPAGFDAFREAVERVGWHDPGLAEGPAIIPRHSRTHKHPRWPCSIDVHHWFPGFLAAPQDVFDVLWCRHTTVILAHAEVLVPDPVAHAALAGLHYLRDGRTSWGREQVGQLEMVLRSRWGPVERSDLARLAADTGAADTLRPLLGRIGTPVVESRRPVEVPYDDWRLRVTVGHRPTRAWVVALRRVPWHRRPALALRALWLSDDHFRSRDPSIGPTASRLEVMGARRRRVARGLRSLPATVVDLRHDRRG